MPPFFYTKREQMFLFVLTNHEHVIKLNKRTDVRLLDSINGNEYQNIEK